MYRLEFTERELEHKYKTAKVTVSPSEERVTVKISKNTDIKMVDSIVFLSNYIRDNIETDISLSLRGIVKFRYNSILQAELYSENKKENRKFLLDLSDNKFKTFKEYRYGEG